MEGNQVTEGIKARSARGASSGETDPGKLAASLAAGRKEIARLKRQIGRLKEEEQRNEGTAYDLRERVKELNCLYSISSIVERRDTSVGEFLQETVNIIPDAWQYPKITCCRIVLENDIFVTPNFRRTKWMQSRRIVADGSEIGSLEVFYLRKKPEKDEGPFLKEERSLINVIAERIGAIVERRRREEALQESEEQNRALLSAIPDLIFQVDRSGTLLGFHEGTFAGIRESLRELVGKSVYFISDEKGFLPRRALEQCMIYVTRALVTGKAQIFEQHISIDGKVRDFEVRIVVSREDEILCMVRDITLRKRLEREILEISGREQRRIGQDLHDSLCQHLAGIGFLSKALEIQIASGTGPKRDDAAEIVRLIDQAITLTRGFARGLNPVRLEADGLLNGLLELAVNSERLFNIKCIVEFEDPILPGDSEAALHLYRIVQEALSNAVKHGRAGTVTIRFRKEGRQNVLSVKDDGVGFANTVSRSNGIGLNIMNYRASVIGASLNIGDGPEGGALVVCTFEDGGNAKEKEEDRRKWR
ncbi:MAG TPA: ATP-binding protein [Syntrophorhabdaceae bacterium]